MKKRALHLKKRDAFFCNLPSLAAESRFAKLAAKLRPAKQKVSRFFGKIRREFEQSLLLDVVRRFFALLLELRLRTVGLLLLSCGIWTAAFHMLRLLLTGGGSPELSVLLFAGGTALSSLPLLCSRRSVSEGILGSSILSFLLFDVLGLYEDSFRDPVTRERGGFTAFMLGIAVGLLTLFIRPWYLLAAVGVILCVAAIFRMPEAGLSILALALPFAGVGTFLVIFLVTWASYLVKLVLGRRSLRFGAADACLFVYALVVLGGTLFPVSLTASASAGFLRLFAVLTGILALQLVRSGKTALRVTGLLTVSVLMTVILGLVGYARQGAAQLVSGHGFPFSTAQMTSLFASPTVFACFLLLLLPFVPAFFSCAGKGSHKVLLFLSLGLCGLCLVLTWDVPAIVGAIFALAVYFLLRRKRGWFGILLLTLVTLGCLVPSGIYESLHLGAKLFPDLPGRVAVATDYLRAVLPCLAVGAGSGAPAPAGLFRGVTDPAYIRETGSGSFYVQSLAENGILGLVLLLLTILCVLLLCRSAVRLGFGFDPEDGVSDGDLLPAVSEETVSRRLTAAGCASLAGILAGGLLLDPFALPATELCFWLILGMTAAVAQSALRRKAAQQRSSENELMLVCGKERKDD